MAYKVLKQIERQLILYDIFQQNNEDTRFSTINYHLPGITKRTLQRDIQDLAEAGVLRVYFSRDIGAYINCNANRDISGYSEGIQKRIRKKREAVMEEKEVSKKRKEHLERLRRLTTLMGYYTYKNAIELYFELFPNATERMRKRDFETLRHIGFFAGYDKWYETYALYRKDEYGIDNSYGVIRSKTGKLMYYVEEWH